MVGAVVLLHVLYHPVAALVVEVHVNIGHRYALGVEETLEKEVVLERVEIGDSQAVGYARAGGRASSRPDGNPVPAAPVDEVLDYQEVVGEAHEGNGHELEMQPLLLFGGEHVAIASACAFVGEVAQIGHGTAELLSTVGLRDHIAVVVLLDFVAAVLYYVGVLRQVAVDILEELRVDLELWQHVAPVDVVSFDFIENLQRVGEGFRMVGKQLRHLLFALEEFLLGVA